MHPSIQQRINPLEPLLHRDGENTRRPLITMDDVTLRKGDVLLFAHTSWRIRDGENWAILGPNGSGKSVLAAAVKGDVACVAGRIVRHVPEAGGEWIGYLSFELQERFIRREEHRDEAFDFSGDLSHAPTAAAMLGFDDPGAPGDDTRFAFLNIAPLLERRLRTLSNGELRKVLIARALLKNPKILILDEPFAGLDRQSRQALARAVADLMAAGTRILLVTARTDEVVAGITHVMEVGNGRVVRSGPREDLLSPEPADAPAWLPALPALPVPPRQSATDGEILVEMNDVRVAYGGRPVLDGLHWKIRRGQHWAVVGPNGSGKTTLLGLITGDNLQAYANEVVLFGRKRGTGESVGEIRSRIGLVSPELQWRYRRAATVDEVVLSGFFDSIGLYHRVDETQKRQAASWLACIGMGGQAGRDFHRLSYGQKRMVLLARAMVKAPELLLLDEPCQGLDSANRRMVLALMEAIGRLGATTMVYVTHHASEMIPCIGHVLTLAMPAAGCATLR